MTTDTEEFTESSEDVEVTTRVRPGKKKKRETERGAPIENSDPIPLFPEVDKDTRNVITTIEVYRTIPPNDGYKGQIPPSATKEFLARRFGNGIYRLEACNADGECLRRIQDVNISIPMVQPPDAQRPLPGMFDGNMAEKLLDRLSTEHAASAARAKDISTEAIQTTREQARTYSEMLREDARARAERDRQYFEAQQKQQQAFFASILAQQQNMHAQSMESQRVGFEQTMRMMQFQHMQSLQQNNPALLFQLFERGLRFGSEMGGGEDSVTSIMGLGLRGLSELKDIALLQRGATPPKLPNGANGPAVKNKLKKPGKSGSKLTRDDVLQMARLKKMARRKGQDFDGMLRQAKSMMEEMPDVPSPDDDSDSDAAPEAGASDMDSGGPTE